MNILDKTTPAQSMFGVTITKERRSIILRLSKSELNCLQRACEILDAAENAALDVYDETRGYVERQHATLADYAADDLYRSLFSGDLRSLLKDHGNYGVILESDAPAKIVEAETF